MIDAALYVIPKMNVLGMFSVENADVYAIHVKKTIYLPAPYVRIFLKRELMPAETWSCLQGTIVDAGAEVDFRPIIDWIQVA